MEALNKRGFTGGIYFYKRKKGGKSGHSGLECSCCFGLRDSFFQVNGNTPGNWDQDSEEHKFTYENKDEARATEFRELLNSLVKEAQRQRQNRVETAALAGNNNEAVIIEFE